MGQKILYNSYFTFSYNKVKILKNSTTNILCYELMNSSLMKVNKFSCHFIFFLERNKIKSKL